ncbi:hypothetical protein GCM10009110_04400 [Psychrobacter piscatorii]
MLPSAAITAVVLKDAAATARARVLIFSAERDENSIFIIFYPFLKNALGALQWIRLAIYKDSSSIEIESFLTEKPNN